MNIFTKAILICALINASSAYKHINPEENTITYEWTGNGIEKSGTDNSRSTELFAGKDHHSLALLKCDFTAQPGMKTCNLTIQTHTFYNVMHQTVCVVYLPFHPKMGVTLEQVKFLQKNAILISWIVERGEWGDDSPHMSYQVISTDECRGNAFVHTLEKVSEEDSTLAVHPVLRYDDHFEIMFHDKLHCHKPNHYCTASYPNNYEEFASATNKAPKTTSKFTSECDKFIFNEVYTMNGNYTRGPVLIGHKNLSKQSEFEHLLSPVVGWTKIAAASTKLHSYSNSSGHATLCWSSMNKMKRMTCMWIDGTRDVEDKMDLEFSHAFDKLPYTHNKPDGSIMLVRAVGSAYNMEKSKIVVDQGYMNGQCKRLVEFEVSDVVSEFAMSLDDHDRYCISYIGKKIQAKGKTPIRNTFVTRCTKIRDEATQEFFNCGEHKNYYL